MATLKYLGGLGAEYHNGYALIPIGGTGEMPDWVADICLRDFPGCFERVGEARSVDQPPNDRMRTRPQNKRGKT